MNIARSIFLSGLAFTLLFVACTGDGKEPGTVAAPTVTAPTVAPAFDPAQVQAQPATAVITDPNPEHGQPGHRCEIPVGASLATAPPPGATGAAPQTSPMFTTTPVEGI